MREQEHEKVVVLELCECGNAGGEGGEGRKREVKKWEWNAYKGKEIKKPMTTTAQLV